MNALSMSRRIAAATLALALAPGVAAQGFPGNEHSYSPSITADGRFLVFMSAASNLVPGDSNGVEDIFLLDRESNALTRVSTNAIGQQANGQSWTPMIAADGRYVVFASNASNLVAGDTNAAADVFRKDLETGAVERVSVSSAGAQGTAALASNAATGETWPSISGEGRFVAFHSSLRGLAPGYNEPVSGLNFPGRILVRDLLLGTTVGVGPADDNLLFEPMIGTSSSAPDTIQVSVVFTSFRALVAADTNNDFDVYLAQQTLTGNEALVANGWTFTLASPGPTGNGIAGQRSVPGGVVFGPSISQGGRFPQIAFITGGAALPGDTNGELDLYQTILTLSRITNGIGTGPTAQPIIGRDGTRYFNTKTGNWETFVGLTIDGPVFRKYGSGTAAPFGILNTVQRYPRGAGGAGVDVWVSSSFEPPGTRVDPFADVFARTENTGKITRASSGRVGTAADGHSRSAAISPDGLTVVFGTHASGFDAADPGANRDLVQRSLVTGATLRIGTEFGNPPRDFRWGDLGADGRSVFIAEFDTPVLFSGAAHVTQCTDPISNAWVRYASLGVTTCLDLDRPGFTRLLAERVFQPVISDDGNFAAFVGKHDEAPFSRRRAVYLVHLNSLTIVSALAMTGDPNPSEATLGLERDTIGLSGDGRYLVFTLTPDSVVGGPNACAGKKVFLHDRVAQTSTPVTPLVGGSLAGAPNASWPTISADGSTVALVSCDNLAGEANPPAGTKLYHWNRATQTFTRIATDTLSRSGTAVIGRPRLSADGRYTAFVVDQNCLDRCATQTREIALFDRQTGALRTVSVTPSWTRANGPAGNQDALSFNTFLHSLDLSADGRKLVFSSSADNLTPGDRNAADDVFVLDVPSQTLSRVSAFGNNPAGDDDRVAPALSGDATTLVYGRKNRDGAIAAGGGVAGGAAKGTSDKWSDIALNTGSGERIISVSPAGAPSNGDSGEPDISADGTFVAFQTDATNLTSAADNNNATDVVVHSVAAGSNAPVAVAGTATPNGPSTQPSIATSPVGDKWTVSLTTAATNHGAATDTNGVTDVLVVTAGTAGAPPARVLASRASGAAGAVSNGPSGQSDLASDASFVTFTSLGSNLVPGDTNGASDIFLRDLVANTTLRVSEPPGGGNANGTSANPVGDKWSVIAQPPGQSGVQWVVVFESDASNLVAGDLNASTDVFARFSNGSVRLLSRSVTSSVANPVPANGRSFAPQLSRDGRYVTFSSTATDLVAGDTNEVTDLFVYDLLDDTIERRSVTRGNGQSNDVSNASAIGVDARGQPVVVFDTAANNLAPGDGDDAFDLYLAGGAANADQVGQLASLAITERVPASTVVGQPYVVVAQVSSPSGPPGGTIMIGDGAGASCSGSVNAQGFASCRLVADTAVNRTLRASFSASVPLAYSAAPVSATHPVTKASSSTTLSLPSGPFVSGQSVPVTATVAVLAPGAATPTGTIAVSVAGGSESCTITLPATSCNLVFATVAANRTVTASYAGNAVLNASSASASATVNLAQTALTLSLPATTIEVGTPVTATIALSVLAPGAGMPTGTVTVAASPTEQCSVTLPATSCPLTFTGSGPRTVTASYAGSPTLAAASASVTRTVVAAGSAIFDDGFEGDGPPPR